MGLPEPFLTRMQAQLGEDFLAFKAAYEAAPWRGVRGNKVKLLDGSEMACLLDGAFSYIPNPHCIDGYAFRSDPKLGQTLAYLAGLFYIQEPSAMSPAVLLDAQPGERVLDLCAAPGGKTTQIAGVMQGKGLLVSNDASPTRVQALVRNIERAGVRNAVVTTEQPHKLAARFPAFFNRVLVDAPCSGEGMFRRDAEVIKAYTANKPEACAVIQSDILRNAAIMVKPGGRLVYSTCTFNTIENEDVIQGILLDCPEFSLIETKRIWPHRDIGEGHFVAVLQKSDTGGEAATRKASPAEAFHPSVTEFFNAFLKCPPLPGIPVKHGNALYLQPESLDLKGLRTARSGWHIGDLAKDRFIPSQALAMALRREEAHFSVNLSEADAWRYIKGESLDSTEAISSNKPWVLICHNNYPLGWARLVQGRLKNQLPTGWVRS